MSLSLPNVVDLYQTAWDFRGGPAKKEQHNRCLSVLPTNAQITVEYDPRFEDHNVVGINHTTC